MDTIIKKSNPLKLLAHAAKLRHDIKHEGQDKFIDLVTHYNTRQISICDDFRKSMRGIIDSTEFAYPNDAGKIIKLAEDYIESTVDVANFFMDKVLSTKTVFEIVPVKQNKAWMKVWMKQNDEIKAGSEKHTGYNNVTQNILLNKWED